MAKTHEELPPLGDSLATEPVDRRQRLLYALADLGYQEIGTELRYLVRGNDADIATRRRALPIYVEFIRKTGEELLYILPPALEDPAWEVREMAIEICRKLQDTRMVNYLAQCLGDSHEPLQEKALWTIRDMECQNPSHLFHVLDLVDDPSTEFATRVRAMQAIAYPQQGNWALERLLNNLREISSAAVRSWAVETFAYVGDKEGATDELFRMIREEKMGPNYDQQTHLFILRALAKVGSPRGTAHLEQYLDSPDPGFGEVAIAGLGNSGDKKYQAVLLKMLEKVAAPAATPHGAKLKELLIYALAGLGYEEIEDKLSFLAFGNSADTDTRRRALPVYVKFLRKIKRDAMDILPRALEEPAWEVREKAIEICRELKDPNAIEFLAPCLADPREALREKALWTIRAFACQDPKLIFNVLDLVDDPSAHSSVRIRAMQALTYPHQGNWAQVALSHNVWEIEPAVRIQAGETFACLADKEAATTCLLGLIKEEQELTNEKPRLLSLFWALAKVGTPRGAGYLERYLTDPDPDLVDVAISALGHSGEQKYLPVLLEMLKGGTLGK